MGQQKDKIAVNGYVLIGKRIADAVSLQDDMELVGVSDVISDWRIKAALERGFHVFSADQDSGKKMKAGGISVSGDLDELLSEINVAVKPISTMLTKRRNFARKLLADIFVLLVQLR